MIKAGDLIVLRKNGLVARVTDVDGNWFWCDKDDFGRWIPYNRNVPFTGLKD